MVKLSLKNIPYENMDLELEDENGKISKYTFKIQYSNLDVWEGLQSLSDAKEQKTETQIKAYKQLYDLIVLNSSMTKEAFFKLGLDLVTQIMSEMIKISTSNTCLLYTSRCV